MEEIERAMCQLSHGNSRSLQWQDTGLLNYCQHFLHWQPPDVQALSKANLRLPNFEATPPQESGTSAPQCKDRPSMPRHGPFRLAGQVYRVVGNGTTDW